MKEMERVEEWMFWNEGMVMNRNGDVFEQGDSVDFVEDVVVGLMDDIWCGTVRVEKGIEVTMMPYSGNLYMDELHLEGTLVFTAPWVLSNHWVIHAGEEGKIVMDMGYFDVELGLALPGEYEGDLELRSGRMRYREDAGKLHFRNLTVKDGAQLALEEGSDYEGEVVLSGKGWSKNDGEKREGCVLFENGGEDRATLSGHIALSGETVLNVAREGDCGMIEGELDVDGHKLVKVGRGELRVGGGRVSGLDEIEVEEGKLIFMEDVETQRLHASGAGELELQGKGNRLDLLELEEETRVEMQAGEIGELRGKGRLTVTGGELRLGKINDFSGELHGRDLWLGEISVEEGAEATVDLLDFERIEVSDGRRVEVRSVRAAGGTTIGGGGELRLRAERQANGELNTGNLIIDGTRLHLLQSREGERSEMARVEVREGGSVYVEEAREGGNTQLHVEELELRGGSRLELVLNLGAALSSGEGDTMQALLSGSVRSEAGAELSLHLTGIDENFEFAGGHTMEFLLADEFTGEITLDEATEEFMKKYFGNSGQLVVRDGMLLFTGTTVTDDPQHPQQDEPTPPSGQEGGETPGEGEETDDPQHPQQDEPTPPSGQEGGETPGEGEETDDPQHPQQDEPTPPGGQEGGETSGEGEETDDPQHPQQDEPTPPSGQEGGETSGEGEETDDPQRSHRGEATTPNGQAGGGLLDDIEEAEDSQHHHETGDRADVLEEEEELISQGKYGESDHLSSAVAGSSLPTLSMALSCAAEAELRGLAERMSGGQEFCKGEEGKRWVWDLQADGAYARLEKEDTFSGYSLRTAGGTVAARRAFSDGKGSIGAAFSGEHGHWRASAEDVAHGQINAAFFTVYGAYLSGKWRHLFAAQGGACTMSPERRVSIGKVSYTVDGRTHGYEAGALYEVMYCGWIAEETEGGLRPFLQAMWQRVDVAGYAEHGSDAALHVGGQTLMRGVVGVGVEWSGQTQFAERRVCWKLRGEIYANLGDRESEARVAFVQSRGHSEKVRSARESVPGVELTGGLYAPAGVGTWYTVGGVDLQNQSWNAKITLGYRISF